MKFKEWMQDSVDAEQYRKALLACSLLEESNLTDLLNSMIKEQALDHFNRHVSAKIWYDDPIEKVVATALSKNVVPHTRNYPRSNSAGYELDFVLPCNVGVEVKRYYSIRSDVVLQNNKNIILIQGQQAAISFAELINRGSNADLQNLQGCNLTLKV